MVKPTGYITIPDAFGAAMKAEYHVQERDGGHIIFTGFPGVMAAYLEYFEKYAEEHLRFSSLLMQVKFRSDTVPVELLYTQSSPFDVLQDVTDWDPRARHPSETTAEVDWPRHLAADWVRHDQEAELATFYLDLRPMPPFLQARGHEWLIDTEVPDWAQPRESLTYWALPPTAIAFFALKDLAAFVVRKDDPAWHAQQDVDPEYRLCFLLRVLWALRSEATDKEHWINTGLWDDYLDDDIEHEITQRGDLKNLATRKATLKYLRNLEAGLGILKTVGLSEGGKSRQLALEEFGCVESTRRAQGAMHKDMLERRYREMFEGFTTLAQERINHFKVSRENIYKPQSRVAARIRAPVAQSNPKALVRVDYSVAHPVADNHAPGIPTRHAPRHGT
ncbi:hypothetical protein JCM3770_007092 [Rhodotorula araucariae]